MTAVSRSSWSSPHTDTATSCSHCCSSVSCALASSAGPRVQTTPSTSRLPYSRPASSWRHKTTRSRYTSPHRSSVTSPPAAASSPSPSTSLTSSTRNSSRTKTCPTSASGIWPTRNASSTWCCSIYRTKTRSRRGTTSRSWSTRICSWTD